MARRVSSAGSSFEAGATADDSSAHQARTMVKKSSSFDSK